MQYKFALNSELIPKKITFLAYNVFKLNHLHLQRFYISVGIVYIVYEKKKNVNKVVNLLL